MQINEALLYRRIGERLKHQRMQHNMTQGQLAMALGMLRTSVANIETGRQKVSLHMLYKLCSELEIEVSTILPIAVEVIEPTVVAVDVDGRQGQAPPKTAEFLRQLIEE